MVIKVTLYKKKYNKVQGPGEGLDGRHGQVGVGADGLVAARSRLGWAGRTPPH